MKTFKFKMVFVVLILLFVTSISCSDDDDNTQEQSGNETITQIENNLKSGTWRVTSFIEDGNDETNHFTGYNFTFQANRVLIAENGTNTYEGSWSITDYDNSDDDGSSDDLDFNINFNLENDFEDLNDDWDIVTHSGSKIELIDVSGGNGEPIILLSKGIKTCRLLWFSQVWCVTGMFLPGFWTVLLFQHSLFTCSLI